MDSKRPSFEANSKNKAELKTFMENGMKLMSKELK